MRFVSCLSWFSPPNERYAPIRVLIENSPRGFPFLCHSSNHEIPSAANGRNQLATKNTKSHKKLHYFEVFVSLRVLCGDQKFAHAAKISTVSGSRVEEGHDFV
jgi:hypothetical protein